MFFGTGEGAGACGAGGAAVLWGLGVAVRTKGGKEGVRSVFHDKIPRTIYVVGHWRVGELRKYLVRDTQEFWSGKVPRLVIQHD